MSVTSIVIKVPQDQKALDTKALPEYLSQLINKLDAIRAGNSQAGSSMEIVDAATYGTGTFTISSGNLAANDTVTVAGIAFAAKASGAVGNQFNIGGSALATAQACAAAINASSNVNTLVTATAAAGASSSGVVTLTASQPGPLGNLITLAKSALNGTVSGATFSGGSASVTTVAV